MTLRNLFTAVALSLATLSFARVVPDKPVFTDTNPGPAISGSVAVAALPDRALYFIDHYYPGIDVSTVIEPFAADEYDVTMDDGTYIEFDKTGYVTDICAPGQSVIPVEAVRSLLSPGAYNELQAMHLEGSVAEVEMTVDGPKTTLRNVSLRDMGIDMPPIPGME